MALRRIAAKWLATPSGLVADPVIGIDGERIGAIGIRSAQEIAKIDYDFPDATITAGFLDIHFHGIAGEDVMHAGHGGFTEIARHLARAGVSRFLPTTVTASMETTLSSLDRMAGYVEAAPANGTAQAVGIHIEGPFLSPAKRGMHPAEHLQLPAPQLLDRLWEAARGHIRLMTIAPELPGALETVEHATGMGIRCSMGHSMATRAEAIAGVESGVVSATHTFNAMRALDHREPGIVGVVLDRDDLYADLICDGLHVAPEAVRLWLKMKGRERAILITDCLSAAGRPNGTYMAGDTVVHVDGDACRTSAGVLAGSVITLDRAVWNLRKVAGVGVECAARLASVNPARMLGLGEVLEPGAFADLNVFGADGIRRGCFIRGMRVDSQG